MVDNPRFPHHVIITRQKVDSDGEYEYDSDGNPALEKVLESECGIRDMVRGTDTEIDVLQADYKLALPRISFIVKFRDTVSFTHSFTGEIIEGRVEAYKTWNFGTNIWFQSNGN